MTLKCHRVLNSPVLGYYRDNKAVYEDHKSLINLLYFFVKDGVKVAVYAILDVRSNFLF